MSDDVITIKKSNWTSNAAAGPILKMYGEAMDIANAMGTRTIIIPLIPMTVVENTRLASSESSFCKAITRYLVKTLDQESAIDMK